MLKEERTKILLSIKDSVYGKALEEELEEKISRIGDIESAKDWEDTVGRKYAIKTLREVFSFITATEPQKKLKSQYE